MVPGGMPVPSTQTFMIEGAVPYLGDRLIQVALLVDVQLRIPPPVLVMEKSLTKARGAGTIVPPGIH